MKKLGIRLLALTLLATVTTGCASSKQENTWDKIKEKKEIVIGTEGTFAPFSYHDDNDNLVGYDVEVSRALAKELGVKVKFVEVKWDSLIAGLDSDKYDLVTNQVAITAERKKKYDFSIPHTYSYPAIITKKDNTEITKMSDIKGRKFSLTGSSNFSKIVEKYKLSPEQIYVIGDNYMVDIEPAYSLGFKTLYIKNGSEISNIEDALKKINYEKEKN